MPQFHWLNCPPDVRLQVDKLAAGFHKLLADNLVGIYLHGSLATSCFNPTVSDIDILVVTHDAVAVNTRPLLDRLLLQIDKKPCPFELSILTWSDIHPWRYPTPYELNYNEHRIQWREPGGELYDEDLAAHITVTHQRGVCLRGAPIADIFPIVPAADYRASILSDLDWAIARMDCIPVYAILNFCRIYAYCRDGRILSKDEGGVWGLEFLPDEFHPLIAAALETYRGNQAAPSFSLTYLEQFARYIKQYVAG